MLAVSARWEQAVLRSRPVSWRAELWRSGSPLGVELSVTGGSVRQDESSQTRRLGTVECADVDLMPADVSDLLAPVGTDLHLHTGITYTEGDTEWVPAGVMRLSKPERGSLLSGGLSLAVADYSLVLAKARFLAPWNVARWASVTGVIRDMVLDVLPWVTVVDLTGSAARHPGGAFERDRWDAIGKLADSISAEVFFDATGTCVIRPVPALTAEPDWVIDHGHGWASLLDARTSMSTDRVYNAVVATSSDSEVPVSAAVAQDSGPLAYGPGRKWPRFYSSPVLTTVEQCRSAAVSLLSRSMAVGQEIAPDVLPNPALEVGDTVLVDLPGMDEPVSRLVSGIDLPIGVGSMSLTLRTEADATDLEGE